jgi:hypothetical protein
MLDTPVSSTPEWLQLQESLVGYRAQKISASLRTVGEKHSMLHVDVLIILYHLARISRGGILEIGAYLGGSTIAMGWGLRDAEAENNGSAAAPRPFACIEPGGSCLTHGTLPSNDILKDLRANLAKREVTGRVKIFEGYSGKEEIIRGVRDTLSPGSVGLCSIDADGEIERDLKLYDGCLQPDCFLVIDDYFGSADKSGPTRVQVDARVRAGKLETLGVYGWGTWVGRRRGA